MMLFEKEYDYTEDSFRASLAILEKTILRKKQIAGMTTFVVIGVLSFVGCAIERDILSGLLCLVIWLVIAFVTRGSFRKEYIGSNSLEARAKYHSLHRRLTVLEDKIDLYAAYQNEDEILTDEDRADADYMQYREECNEEMGHEFYRYGKSRCYESADGFLIYRDRDTNEFLLKSQLSPDEAEKLRAILQEKYGKRYLTVNQ